MNRARVAGRRIAKIFNIDIEAERKEEKLIMILEKFALFNKSSQMVEKP